MKFKKGQTIIFEVDVYGDGNVYGYGGEIVNIYDDSVDVVYLDGYRSRNGNVKFEDIIALVDDTKSCEF